MVLVENTMSTGTAAKLLGVSVKTLQRWEREGRLIPVARTDGNRRRSTETQIRELIGLRQTNHAPTNAGCLLSGVERSAADGGGESAHRAGSVRGSAGMGGRCVYRGNRRRVELHAQAVADPYGRDRATGRHDADPRAPEPPHPFRHCVVRT